MNKQLKLPQIQKIMMEFEKQVGKQYQDFKSGAKLYILLSDFIIVSMVLKWWELV